ncbi:integrase core domain-containing protein, partial [Xanthomonas euvesicatoria]|uniref:integrase core domain-containing protein n=1 Tax=Xanthomonas euvesicatoria TaxID=456327 RepID=UPI0026E3A3DE
YVESFNGRLRDECLNEHWFPTLLHARTEIERWRREYNEERPKMTLPLFAGVLSPRITRPFYAVPRTSVAHIASG